MRSIRCRSFDPHAFPAQLGDGPLAERERKLVRAVVEHLNLQAVSWPIQGHHRLEDAIDQLALVEERQLNQHRRAMLAQSVAS